MTTIEAAAKAAWEELNAGFGWEWDNIHESERDEWVRRLRYSLLHLADNPSDRMVCLSCGGCGGCEGEERCCTVERIKFSAALMAAVEE